MSRTIDDYYTRPIRTDRIGRRRIWPSVADRFWPRVDASLGRDGCWPWTGYRTPKDYGQVGSVDRTVEMAHRVAFQLANRVVLPPAEPVLHSCDNPPCCNPVHLRRGTPAENIQDMIDRGRMIPALGLGNGRTKLTGEQVKAIRAAVAAGRTRTAVAAEFGVHPAHVSRLVRGLRRPILVDRRGGLQEQPVMSA